MDDSSDSESENEGVIETHISALKRELSKLRAKRNFQKMKASEMSEKLGQLFVSLTAPVPTYVGGDGAATSSQSSQQNMPSDGAQAASASSQPQVQFRKSRTQEDLEWARQQPRYQQELEAVRAKYKRGQVSEADMAIFAFINTMNALRPLSGSRQQPPEEDDSKKDDKPKPMRF